MSGNKILREKSNEKDIIYHYAMDELVGFLYNSVEYIFERNIKGDILGIYKKDDLTRVAEYVYDAYGNHKVINYTVINIGDINPIRYRGYYFDTETKLYYLNSRYYNPESRRFISPDTLSILDETKAQINGLNLYMYCADNPVMNVDPSGMAWWDILAWIGVGLFAAALTIVTLGAAGIAIGGIAGGIIMGDAIGTLALGVAGAAIGAVGDMIYDAAKGNDFGTSIWTWTKAGFGIGAIAGSIIGGAIGGAAGASLTGANNLMLWTGLGKNGATIAAQEAGKMGLKTIGQHLEVK